MVSEMNEWKPVTFGAYFPKMKNGDVVKTYVWNPTVFPVFIDDFKVELFTGK
jgi:hypothetical protein